MFGRSHRNSRRARRSELLRVKAEAGARARWVRRAVIALGLAVLGLAGLHVASRSWTSLRDGFFLSRRFFALRSVEVNSNLFWLTPTQIVRWTGVRLGENLLALDLDRIKRDLELVPQVEEAALERVLPDLLRIHVRERQPVARIRGILAGQGQLQPATLFLDAQAHVLPPLFAERPDLEGNFAQLPVLSGVNSQGLHVGGDLGSPGVRAALALVRLFPHSDMAGHTRLLTVDVAEPEVLQVTTAQGAEIVLPLQRMEWELHRWRLVHDAAARLGKQIRWLDLSVTNHCPALWQPDAPESPPLSQPVESTQPRDRHV